MSYKLGDEFTGELSACCDANVTNTGFCGGCGENV